MIKSCATYEAFTNVRLTVADEMRLLAIGIRTATSLAGHRMFYAIGGIALGAVLGWLLSDQILRALSLPLSAIVDTQVRVASLNFTDISEAFDLRLQIAINGFR